MNGILQVPMKSVIECLKIGWSMIQKFVVPFVISSVFCNAPGSDPFGFGFILRLASLIVQRELSELLELWASSFTP